MADTEIFRFMFVKPPVLKSGKDLASKNIKHPVSKSQLFKILETFKNNNEVEKIILTAKNSLSNGEVYVNIIDLQKEFMEEEDFLGWIMTRLDKITIKEITAKLQNKNIILDKIQKLWDTLIVHSIMANSEGITDLVVGLIKFKALITRINNKGIKNNSGIRLVMESMVELPIEIFPINVPKQIAKITDSDVTIGNPIAQKEIVEQVNSLNDAKKELKKTLSNKIDLIKNKFQTLDDYKEEYNFQNLAIPVLNTSTEKSLKAIKDGDVKISDEELEKRYNKSVQQRNASKLSNADIQKLRAETKKILEKFQIVISENQDIPDLINEIDKTMLELASNLKGSQGYKITYIEQGVAYDFSADVLEGNVCLKENSGLSYCDLLRKLQQEDPSKPIVNILGIGEYKVIRQKLIKYEAGEIANIKNVFAGEIFKNSIRNLKKTEEIIVTETERETKQDNEASSTDRYEINKEIQEQSDKSSKLEIGLSSTATYGTTVSVAANASYSGSSNSSKESKSASNYAKETTEKASNSIREKIREKRSKTTLNEIEIITSYELNNNTPNHKVGVFFWVDKTYSNQLFNIGNRLMLEFYIPSPMAFYIHSRRMAGKKGVSIINPIPPRNHTINGLSLLSHKDLTRDNYHLWVNAYNVRDYSLPPKEFVNLQYGFMMTGTHGTPSAWQEKIDNLPKGYAAIEGVFFANTVAWIKAIPNSWYYDSPSSGRQIFSMPEIENEITFSGLNNGPGFAYFGVKCQLTINGYEQWKVDTYAAILESYESMKADYENQLSAAQIQGGIQIEGNNPDMNTAIIKEEIEKWCSEALLLSRFNGWNAMQKAVTGEPEIDFNLVKKETPIVSFMSSAFEWNNMTYKFLPYFYSNKAEHTVVREITDVDPKFMAALRAGYARVIIPVSFGFEKSVLHFIKTGQVWNGGNLPVLGDPLFQSIVDTIYGEEYSDLGTPEGDPWETKLPTTLVWLQNNLTDGQLPII